MIRNNSSRIVLPLIAGLFALPGPGVFAAGPDVRPIPTTLPDSNAPKAAVKTGPRIVIPEQTQTRDGIDGGAEVHFNFEVRNEGTADLEIRAVLPSCHCTVASFDPLIHPGGKGTIRASIHTEALWGSVSKTLSVISNDADPDRQNLTLFLIAHVTPALTVTPMDTVTVSYDDPKPIERSFTVQYRRMTGTKPQNPPAVSGPVQAQIQQDAADPSVFHVLMKLSPPPTGGDILGEVDFRSNLPGVPLIPLRVAALGQKGLVYYPGLVRYGLMAARLPSTQMMTLFSRHSTFHITRLESSDPAVQLEYTQRPAAVGTWYEVRLNYQPGGWTPGLHKGTVNVYTDLPIAPLLKVPFEADVQ